MCYEGRTSSRAIDTIGLRRSAHRKLGALPPFECVLNACCPPTRAGSLPTENVEAHARTRPLRAPIRLERPFLVGDFLPGGTTCRFFAFIDRLGAVRDQDADHPRAIGSATDAVTVASTVRSGCACRRTWCGRNVRATCATANRCTARNSCTTLSSASWHSTSKSTGVSRRTIGELTTCIASTA